MKITKLAFLFMACAFMCESFAMERKGVQISAQPEPGKHDRDSRQGLALALQDQMQLQLIKQDGVSLKALAELLLNSSCVKFETHKKDLYELQNFLYVVLKDKHILNNLINSNYYQTIVDTLSAYLENSITYSIAYLESEGKNADLRTQMNASAQLKTLHETVFKFLTNYARNLLAEFETKYTLALNQEEKCRALESKKNTASSSGDFKVQNKNGSERKALRKKEYELNKLHNQHDDLIAAFCDFHEKSIYLVDNKICQAYSILRLPDTMIMYLTDIIVKQGHILDFIRATYDTFSEYKDLTKELLTTIQKYIGSLACKHMPMAHGFLWEIVVARYASDYKPKLRQSMTMNIEVYEKNKDFSRQFDISFDDLLIECKNINWDRIFPNKLNRIKQQLKDQKRIANSHNCTFIMISKTRIPQQLANWLKEQEIVYFAPLSNITVSGLTARYLFNSPYTI